MLFCALFAIVAEQINRQKASEELGEGFTEAEYQNWLQTNTSNSREQQLIDDEMDDDLLTDDEDANRPNYDS